MTSYVMNIGKLAAHVVLIGISALLSINLFIKLGTDIVSKVLLSMMAGSLEMMKIWLFVHGKYLISKKGEKVKQVVTYKVESFFIFMLYLSLAFLSCIASVGYSISTVEMQSFQVEEDNFEIDMLLDEINSNKKQIEIIQENATGLEFSAVERVEKANEQIKKIQEENRALIEEVSKVRSSKTVTKQKANDIFISLGKYVNMSGKDMMRLILLALAILLEITSAVSAPNEENIRKGTKVKDIGKSRDTDKKKIYNWEVMISSLFNTGGASKLKAMPIVAKETGYPLDVVKKMRDTLMNVKHEKKPLIYKNKNGSMYANVDKEKILHIARNYL